MNILIIDDEKSIRFSLKTAISKLEGVTVLTAESGEEGLQILTSQKIDIAIIDIKLPGIDGLEVLKRINSMKLDTTVIMITFLSEVRLAVSALKMGAYDYFTKPFSVYSIIEDIRSIIKYRNVKEIIDIGEKDNMSRLVGESHCITGIKGIISKMAQKNLNTNILITGESGTGKEVVANCIHDAMHRGKPFVSLNCAAIAATLQESELFGYEKGAFTEAKTMKKGLMEEANGGVLLLDEIGDMDLSLQKKLLRALQEKKFRRVGGTKELELNCTIVSATNKNLQEEIRKGNFRQDLYYRINVIPIHITPLRERREDIPLLVNFFLGLYNSRVETQINSITDDAIDKMASYDWPGNARELKNAIERMVILLEKDYIDIADLPEEILASDAYDLDGIGIIENAEKSAIERILQKNDYNISKSAEELNITRVTLRNKIKRYGIMR